MALPSTSLGATLQIVGQDLYTSSSTQQHVLGSYAETPDGRGFRYCKNGGTALVPGKLYQSRAEDTTNFQNLTAATNSVGDTTVTTTSTVTLTANQLAGGYLVIESATTGAGQTYKIKSHPAASGAVVTFTLEDPIRVATTGTVNIDVHPHPYDAVIVTPTTSTSASVGFAVHAVAANEYGWLQTHGPCAALAQGTVVVGDGVILAETTTTGAIVSQGNDTHDQEVGYALTGIASGDYGLIFATID